MTPVMIVGGAIFLFRTMESSGAMEDIRLWLNNISRNPVAQLMIVGWAFEFLIEGASGFGTPAALAAPILVGLGFKPLKVAVFALMMNTIPVSFGAVGTPTWFGFSGIDLLTTSELSTIGIKTTIIHGVAALIIPLLALKMLIPWSTIKRNLPFIYGSIIATILPYITVSTVNYEFPALAGGFIGLIITVFIASKGWGLEKTEQIREKSIPRSRLIKALFPLWGTLLLLIITRVPQLGLKSLLTVTEPNITTNLGTLGTLSLPIPDTQYQSDLWNIS